MNRSMGRAPVDEALLRGASVCVPEATVRPPWPVFA